MLMNKQTSKPGIEGKEKFDFGMYVLTQDIDF